MSETTTEAPTEAPQTIIEQEISPEIANRRKKELGLVTSSILKSEANGENPQDNPVAKAVLSAEYASKRTAEDNPLKFNIESSDEKGEPTIVNHDGEASAVYEIIGVEGTDNLVCTVIHTADIGQDNASKYTVTLSRKEVHDAILIAEKNRILGGLTGDRQEIVQKYIDSVDPDTQTPEITDEMVQKMEAVARERGMLTASDLSKIIDQVVPQDDSDREGKKAVLNSLNDKTIIDRDDFQEALSLIGISPEKFESQAKSISAEIIEQKNILQQVPENEIAKRRLEQAERNLQVLNNIDKLWEDAVKEGKTPFEDYFQKSLNGELKAGEMSTLITSLAEGDMDKLAKLMPSLMGKTKEEQEKIRDALEIAKKGGKGIVYTLLFLLGLSASLAINVVSEAASNQR